MHKQDRLLKVRWFYQKLNALFFQNAYFFSKCVVTRKNWNCQYEYLCLLTLISLELIAVRKKVKRFWKVHIFDESHLSKQQNRNLSKYAALKKGFLKKSNIIGFSFQFFLPSFLGILPPYYPNTLIIYRKIIKIARSYIYLKIFIKHISNIPLNK